MRMSNTKTLKVIKNWDPTMCSCMRSKSSGWIRRNALYVVDLARCYKMTQLYQTNLHLYKIVLEFLSPSHLHLNSNYRSNCIKKKNSISWKLYRVRQKTANSTQMKLILHQLLTSLFFLRNHGLACWLQAHTQNSSSIFTAVFSYSL